MNKGKIPKKFQSKSRMNHNMAMRGTWDNIEYFCTNCQIWTKTYYDKNHNYGAHIKSEKHRLNVIKGLHDLNEKRKNGIEI